MTRIEQLVSVLSGHRVLIQTHNFPDPDALASAYGLQFLLEQYGVESHIVYDGALNKLSGIRLIEYFQMDIYNIQNEIELHEDDYVVVVDAQKFNRNCTDLPGQEVACIDHHPTAWECEYLYKDVRKTGACASLITEYITETGMEIPVNVATMLLYGIKMDTMDFSRGVSELDIRMFYELFQKADQTLLSKLMMNTLEFSDLRAYGAALSSVSVYKNIGFAEIPFDCPDALIAIISDFILALDVVEFSIVYSIREKGYKFSVRSEEKNLDAGVIIRKALNKLGDGSGGGHSFMAGGYLPVESVQALQEAPRRAIEKTFIEEIYPEDKDYEKDIVCVEGND